MFSSINSNWNITFYIKYMTCITCFWHEIRWYRLLGDIHLHAGTFPRGRTLAAPTEEPHGRGPVPGLRAFGLKEIKSLRKVTSKWLQSFYFKALLKSSSFSKRSLFFLFLLSLLSLFFGAGHKVVQGHGRHSQWLWRLLPRQRRIWEEEHVQLRLPKCHVEEILKRQYI